MEYKPMYEPIKPVLREGYIPEHLLEETLKREIKPLDYEVGGLRWWQMLWLHLKRRFAKK